MITKGIHLFKRVLLCGGLLLFVSAPFTELGAQRRAKKEQKGVSAGIRLASFSTAGDINESLPSGSGFQLYYDQPFAFFLSGKLPSYMPASLQAVLNAETLSNEEKKEGITTENSLKRTGLEVGPRWYFPFGTSHGLSLLALLGFASETATMTISNDSGASETEEKSGTVFSSHFLINYEYHIKTDFLFSAGPWVLNIVYAGPYIVYGADKESPLIGLGFNLGLGYRF